MGPSTGPGGPQLSSAKKRRLAALEQRSTGAPLTKKATLAASSGAAQSAPSRTTPDQQQTSSQKPPPEGTTPAVHPRGDGVYASLLETVATGPVAQSLRFTAEGSLATMLEELMATNPRASDSKTIAGGKLRDKTLLLDNPAVQRDQKRRGGGGLPLTTHLATRKEQRRQGLYNIKNAANLSFNSVLDIHRQWQQYIHNLVHPAQNLKEAQQLIFNADLHGCLLRVVEASESRHVDLKGIVVRNTLNAFFLVTPDDRIVMILKKDSVFEYAIDGKRVVTLLGSGLLAAGNTNNSNGSNGGGTGKKKKKNGANKKKK